MAREIIKRKTNKWPWITLLVLLSICTGTVLWWYMEGPGAKPAQLILTTTPEEAHVYVDELFSVTTPGEISGIKHGLHHIKVAKYGYRSQEMDIRLKRGEKKELAVTLTPLKAHFVITSEPAGADVFLNEIKQCSTPCDIADEGFGTYAIRITKTGYESHNESLYFFKGDEKKLHVTLKPITFALMIETKPSGAEIIVDNSQKYKSPVTINPISEGMHQVAISMNQYHERKEQVMVKGGEPTILKVELQPRDTTFAINTIPSDALVDINGLSAGMTPVNFKNVPPGTYTITVSKTGYKPQSKKITVQKGDDNQAEFTLIAIPKPGTIYKEPATGMEFIWIKEGCFLMGSPDSEPYRDTDEGPQKNVCIKGFWMGKYEVTQEQWEMIMKNNPSGFRIGKTHPVENVSWNEAAQFAERLVMINKTHKFRLPTEAEWEYACRAGTNTIFSAMDSLSDAKANFNGRVSMFTKNAASREKTMPAGSFAQNPFGIFDLHGNVAEWCQDSYSPNFYKQLNDGHMAGVNLEKTSQKVIRGGSWFTPDISARCANRGSESSDTKTDTLGFRLMMEE